MRKSINENEQEKGQEEKKYEMYSQNLKGQCLAGSPH